MKKTSNYNKIFGSYWKRVDAKITELIKQHIEKDKKLFEIGFASGHYISSLTDEGYSVSGIEVREEAYENVKDKFKEFYPNVNLILGNIMDYMGEYDLVYSTGLIQCLQCEERIQLFKHISEIAPKVIYTVPKIEEDRNIGSNEKVAVSGCEEYKTANIAYELSGIYKYVETGIWDKEEIGLEDDFIWFYCNNPR